MSARRVMLAELLRRELTMPFLIAVLLAAACAVWIAMLQRVPVSGTASSDVVLALPRLLRRADLLLLGSACVLSALLVTQRIADDRAAAWLEPLAAAGQSRAWYALALTVAVGVSRYLWFAVSAAAFIVATSLHVGSGELLHVLPQLLAAGLLLMAAVTAYAALWGALVRDAIAAVSIAAVFSFTPLVAAALLQLRLPGAAPPLLLRAWLFVTPPITLADSAASAIVQLCYALAMTALLAMVAHHRVGRRT